MAVKPITNPFPPLDFNRAEQVSNKGDTIRKFIERMSDIDRENMKDRYLPHRPFIDDEYPVMNYWNEYSARFNWGSRNDV